MSTPNTDDTDMTTDTEENENNNDKTANRHINIEDSVDSRGALMNQIPAYNRLVNAEILVQAEEGHVSGKVTKRVFSPDGKVAGKYDDNPYLNAINVRSRAIRWENQRIWSKYNRRKHAHSG